MLKENVVFKCANCDELLGEEHDFDWSIEFVRKKLSDVTVFVCGNCGQKHKLKITKYDGGN